MYKGSSQFIQYFIKLSSTLHVNFVVALEEKLGCQLCGSHEICGKILNECQDVSPDEWPPDCSKNKVRETTSPVTRIKCWPLLRLQSMSLYKFVCVSYMLQIFPQCLLFLIQIIYVLAYFHVQWWRGWWWSYRRECVRLPFNICKHDATDYFKETSRQISSQATRDKKQNLIFFLNITKCIMYRNLTRT